MDDALRVGSIQSIGHLHPNLQDPVGRESLVTDYLFQSPTLQVLHGDEGVAFMFPQIEDLTDIGVIQGSRRLGFQQQPFSGGGVFLQEVEQKLQSDLTVQASVLGPVDHTHPTPSEFLFDSVMRDGLADHGSRTGAQGRLSGSSPSA